MSVAVVRLKKIGVEISVPWNGRKTRLQIPIRQAVECELPEILKKQMQEAQNLGGELKQIKTVSESLRAEIWFPKTGDSFEKFCAQESVQIESFMLMIQITFNSTLCIDVHEVHSFMNALERKRECLGREVDQTRNFLKFLKDRNGAFQSAYTKGRSSNVFMDLSYENRKDWLATIGALK